MELREAFVENKSAEWLKVGNKVIDYKEPVKRHNILKILDHDITKDVFCS